MQSRLNSGTNNYSLLFFPKVFFLLSKGKILGMNEGKVCQTIITGNRNFRAFTGSLSHSTAFEVQYYDGLVVIFLCFFRRITHTQ